MKTPAELAARLRKMVLAAQHHYSPSGEPLRSIVVTPEWLEDMADAANALEHSIPTASFYALKSASYGSVIPDVPQPWLTQSVGISKV